MRTPSKKAWELAHSMTEEESKKFLNRALDVNRGKQTQYLTLFLAIREQHLFDEIELRKILKGEALLGHLHRVKSYLYEKLQSFLRDVNTDGETEIFKLVDNIKVLLNKRLYSHVQEQIEHATTLAEEIEDFLSHLKLLKYKRELIGVSKNWGVDVGDIRNVTAKEFELRKLDAERFELQKILDSFVEISRISPSMKKIEQLKKQLNKIGKPQSKTGEILHCRIRINIALRTGNYNNCIHEADKIISIFTGCKTLMRDSSNFRVFVMSIYYAAIYRVFLKEYDKSTQIITLLECTANARKRDPSLYFEIKILHEQWLGLTSLDLSRSRQAIAEFWQLPKEVEANMDPVKKIEIFHTAANFSIIDGKPKNTLEYINLIRNIKPNSLRTDIRYFTRILFLVAHYDLENLDVMEAGIRAARISFKRKKVENQYYTAILKMFSKIVRAKSPEKAEYAIREFLNGFTGDSAHLWDRMNNYFNIKVWLTSKLAKCSFLDTLLQIDNS